MITYSSGYRGNRHDQEKEKEELQLFCDNIDLLLRHEDDIFACDDYFLCLASFAWCSWPYISGDGLICMGDLLSGWGDGALIGKCPDCCGKVLVNAFGGSPLSGSNWWRGYCQVCQHTQNSRWEIFGTHVDYILQLRRKQKMVLKQVADPISFESLINELKSGNVRKRNPPKVH